jgi:hypothetical protein
MFPRHLRVCLVLLLVACSDNAGQNEEPTPDAGLPPVTDVGVVPGADASEDTHGPIDDVTSTQDVESNDAGDATDGPDTLGADESTCTEFVVMDEVGRFRLEGEPYALHGINLHASIGAVVTNAHVEGLEPDDYQWEYFVAPYGNYLPDNHGICSTPWADRSQCCDSAESCREMFINEHVERVVALGANSVRLVDVSFSITDDGVPVARCARLWDDYSQRDLDAGRPCQMDLSNPELRSQYIEIVRDTVRILGERGIRTIHLPEGKNADRGSNHFVYLEVLEALSTALADEPWLLGYDPMNEPVYFYRGELVDSRFRCADGSFCKTSARAVSKGWFEALTANAPHHFVTVGQGNTTLSLISWDPLVVYDHFTSWHVYPRRPWDDGNGPHASRGFAAQIYHASLAACGLPCPYLGEEDEVGCKVAEGPVAADGFIWNDGFYLPYRSAGERCPVGSDDGANCLVAKFVRGRDRAEIRRQPFFYVAAQDGQCPADTTFDGANCLVAEGPLGATGFIGELVGVPQFYWEPMENEPPCAAPATWTQQGCRIGTVPTGWSPFIVYKSHFYVDAVTCGPRRPAHFGETGFSVFPNGENLHRAAYEGNPGRMSKYRDCVDGQGAVRPDVAPHGTEAEQVEFLMGAARYGWDGAFPMSHACGFQGMHWWALAGVHWGLCSEDHYGLFAYWYLKQDAAPEGDLRALVPRAAAAPYRDQVDYTAPPASKCQEPDDFRANHGLGGAPTRYRFTGRILDSRGEPVPNAMFYAWHLDWTGPSTTFADADGYFTLEHSGCLVQGGATHFGYTNAARSLSNSCPSPQASPVNVSLGNFTINPRTDLPTEEELAVPRTRRRVCLVDGQWVDRPL